jgi:hypothetical protein
MKSQIVKQPEPKIPWSKMVDDLVNLGYGYSDLMKTLGAGYYTFRDLHEGRTKDPLWSTGEKLRAFHQKKMRNMKRRKKVTGK